MASFDIVVIPSGSDAVDDKRTDGLDRGESTSCS